MFINPNHASLVKTKSKKQKKTKTKKQNRFILELLIKQRCHEPGLEKTYERAIFVVIFLHIYTPSLTFIMAQFFAQGETVQ